MRHDDSSRKSAPVFDAAGGSLPNVLYADGADWRAVVLNPRAARCRRAGAGRQARAVRAGDWVIAVRDFGGVVRERVPTGACGLVVEAPWPGPARVRVEVSDWWNGRRQVTVDVWPGEVAVIAR
jgi:hypothetical protein